MKPNLYDSTNFGKNELNDPNNQNYLQLNYQFKFRYLNENVQTVDKTMEPIDLSIKRTSSTENHSSTKIVVEQKSKEIDKQNVLLKTEQSASVQNVKPNDQLNEAKLLPYLLISNNNQTAKSNENVTKTDQITEPANIYSDTDLSLKYNKKKLFLASIRKQSSSTDNSSNLSTNGIHTFSSSSSPSSSANSPNSTPSSLSHTSTNQLTNSDRRDSSSSTTSSTNLSLSPTSDNNLNDDLDNQRPIKEFDQYQRNLLVKDELFDNRLCNLPNSFSKKFEYFSKHYKLNELKQNGQSINDNHLNGNHLNGNHLNGNHLNGNHLNGNHLNGNNLNGKSTNGQSMNEYKMNGKDKLIQNNKLIKENMKDNLTNLRCLKSFQKCNNKRTYIGLKRSLSESYLKDQKQEIKLNFFVYKCRQLKRWKSESDLIDRCNQLKQSMNHDQIHKELNKETNLQITINKQFNGQLNGLKNDQTIGLKQQPNSLDYRQRKLNELKIYENEMKKQLIDKQIKEQELYLTNTNHMKEEDLMNYTKLLIRSNQKNFYQFNHQFNQIDKFNQIKSNSLPLNLQLNRTKASLAFNNSQLFNKKSLINGQCNKINEKTGKRKFTKLASDEDEEDLEEDDENEENIIVDNLSNTASSSVSPSSIQSNSDSSIINKQLLAKHHLDSHSDSLDLRFPFINHPAPHLTNHLNSLSRRPISGVKQVSNFGQLSNDLLQNETANLATNPKDDLTWKLYKDYFYLLNQPDSPAKLAALQWIMKDLNEKNNNHINLTDDWSEQELIKLHAYKQSYKQSYSHENNGPINLSMFNNLTRSNNSTVLDQSHRQLLNTSRLDKFTSNSPHQPINLGNIQLTPDNYLQYVKMNENLINSNRHLNNSNHQLQILTGQSYLNLENANNHCLPPGTPNSFQDRKRISRPLTGRHVRQGTGASPTTLANLKSMIKERQKFREINGGLGVNGKKFRKKRK